MRYFWQIAFVSILCLPSLLSRSVILYRQLPFRLRLYGLHGFLQDVLLIFIQLSLITGVNWKPLIFLGSVCFAFIQLDILVDGCMYHTTKIRLEVPFFAFLNDIGCFFDSAKEKGIAWLYPLGMVFFGVSMGAFFKMQALVFPLQYNYFFLFFSGCLGTIILFFRRGFSEKICYHIDNIIILQMTWMFKRGRAFIARKSDLVKAKELSSQSIFNPQSESWLSVSSTYPLFKYTKGFSGEKQVDVLINPSEKPHVIFLFMESFRAKEVEMLGGKHQATPCFDKLAKEGILFSRFYANSIKTSRIVTSSLFGIPSDVNSSERSSRLDMPFMSLADVLAEAGYCNSYLHNGLLEFENQSSFFSRYGYSTLIGKEMILKKYPEADGTSWGVHDEYLMRYSADFLESQDQKGESAFMTMFTISNHHPWISPPDGSQHYINEASQENVNLTHEKFLKTTHYSDAQLGLFIELLREKKLLEKTIIFVMGDHGHPMGEHQDNFCQQRYLYEENIHVPLLIIADGRIPNPYRIDALGSQLDLIPTVMDLLQIQGFNHARGTSLLRKADRQVFFHNPYGYQWYGTCEGSYKFIYTKASQEVELYDVIKDPDEKENLCEKHPELVQRYLEDVQNYHKYYESLYGNKCFSPAKISLDKFLSEFETSPL
jgi:glucan phosphoethanolaminetransferase (alkaline phosphatase superfamily)